MEKHEQDCRLDESLIFDLESDVGKRGPNYCRTWSCGRERFQAALLEVYHRSPATHSALLFPSGMAAIGASIASLGAPCGWKSLIVYGSELYCDVPRTIRHLTEAHSPLLSSVGVDIRDHEKLREIFTERGKEIVVFHLEACTNPSGQLFDFSVLAELKAQAPHCTFIVDNTWLSGVLFNPLDHGADLVVESLTKYVSGSRCIGGAVVGKDADVAKVMTWCKVFGQFVATDHCDLFVEAMQDLEARVLAASQVAQDIAVRLEGHAAVSRVMYPMLSSHPTHLLTKTFLTKGGPGCIWFHILAPRAGVVKAMERCGEMLEFKTSFGGPLGRWDPWPIEGDSTMHENPHTKSLPTRTGTWVRLACGYRQCADDLWPLIVAMLKKFQPGGGDQVVVRDVTAKSSRWRANQR